MGEGRGGMGRAGGRRTTAVASVMKKSSLSLSPEMPGLIWISEISFLKLITGWLLHEVLLGKFRLYDELNAQLP